MTAVGTSFSNICEFPIFMIPLNSGHYNLDVSVQCQDERLRHGLYSGRLGFGFCVRVSVVAAMHGNTVIRSTVDWI